MAFTLGIDYGTNSVRTLVVECSTGKEWGSCVVPYPSGKEGVLLDSRDIHLARQHPGDYLTAMEKSVRGALQEASAGNGFFIKKIVGIGVDSTGSSPLPVDHQNIPLALQSAWKDHLAAQCWLWKDHTSHREAARITELASQHRPHYIAKCGNTYSSEWFWSKIWHCLNSAPEVFRAAFSWVELCDWIPAVLAGVKDPRKIKRGICAAGHKAMYCQSWGGLPDHEFLSMMNPELADLRNRLYDKAWEATESAGELCPEWAEKLGLPEGIPIAVGAFDVHYGAIGCGIQEGILVKTIGTSTCDCSVVANRKNITDIPGICGIVEGSILPDHFGIEAGQSAVGDIFKWWVEGVCRGDDSLHAQLTREAEKLKPGQSGLLALDWNNGNRTILVDPLLSGLLLGQSLYTTQAEIYRALIEATAFGARAIIERIKEYGVPIEKVICCGGIAEKNPFLMQIYADVTGCTMQIATSNQACALGSSMVASILAGSEKGGHSDFVQAQKAMTSVQSKIWKPRPENQKIYDQLYKLYRLLHDSFGGIHRSADLSIVMKDLIAIQKGVSL